MALGWGVGYEYLGTWWLSSRAFLEKRVRIIWGWNNIRTGGYLKNSSIALNHFWSMRLLVVNKYQISSYSKLHTTLALPSSWPLLINLIISLFNDKYLNIFLSFLFVCKLPLALWKFPGIPFSVATFKWVLLKQKKTSYCLIEVSNQDFGVTKKPFRGQQGTSARPSRILCGTWKRFCQSGAQITQPPL